MRYEEKKKLRDDKIICGDVLKKAKFLENEKYQLIISSPPYNVGKEYEKGKKLTRSQYIDWMDDVISALVPKLSKTGSICWQVGNTIEKQEVFPLDILFYDLFKKHDLKLRNRIVWHFNFGLHSNRRLSGRYETLLWFTKSDSYTFNLDPIRVPQKYPGKRHASTKGEKSGQLSGNPKGKNPSDFWEFNPKEAFIDDPIWELPNVKANHPEKTIHPCQFPSELVERCVLALTSPSDEVLDPFVGTGTAIISAMKHNRVGTGIELDNGYVKLARQRIKEFRQGKLKLRNAGQKIYSPSDSEKVAAIPTEWLADAAE